jgi:hypothetical protein
VLAVSYDAWLYLALIADAYERGGWPAPEGRIRPVGALAGTFLAVPLLDGTWRADGTADPIARAHELGAVAVTATTARAGFAELVTFRRAEDVRFGALTVSAGVHPRRIVVAGPNLPTVEITRHGPGDDLAPEDPIGTRRAGQLTLLVNGRQGVLLPNRRGPGRTGHDVEAAAWNRRYRLRQTGAEHAEVLRGEERVARLLRGDPEPDRRYAVGWDQVADGIDRAMTHALASAFRVGATTLRERMRSARTVPAPVSATPLWPSLAQPAGVLLERGVDRQGAGHHQAQQRIR